MCILVQILFFRKNKKDVVVIDSIFLSYTSINQLSTILLCKLYYTSILYKMILEGENAILHLCLIQDN